MPKTIEWPMSYRTLDGGRRTLLVRIADMAIRSACNEAARLVLAKQGYDANRIHPFLTEEPAPTGISQLRRAVRLFDDTREDAIDSYSPDELLRLAEAHAQSGWDIYPDQWSQEQRDAAAKHGTVPKFNDNGEPC